MIRRNSLMLAFAIACATINAELMPDELDLIEGVFAPTNTPVQAERGAYTILSNCWFSLSNECPLHAREVQYCVLTNACRFNTGEVLYWVRNGMDYRYHLFRCLCSFRCETSDLEYLEQCADFLGMEMKSITNRVDIPARAVFNYNSEVRDSREMMIRRYAELVSRFERNMMMEERLNFRTNIINRARLTDEEQRILWPEE